VHAQGNSHFNKHFVIYFQVNEIIKSMDSKSIFVNPKHITAITFLSKPNIYPSASEASSLAFVMKMSHIVLAVLTTCL